MNEDNTPVNPTTDDQVVEETPATADAEMDAEVKAADEAEEAETAEEVKPVSEETDEAAA